jgi:hypothetical protein
MIYALITLSLFSPLLVILAYRQGIKDGRAIISNTPLRPLIQPPRAPKDNPEAVRLDKILANIDNYDGTGKGQEVIK